MLDSLLFSRHLEEDETTVQVVHRHWVFGLSTLLFPSMLFLIALIIPLIIDHPFAWIALLIIELMIAVWWLRNFFDYYLDAWIITDQAVIDLAWHGWFHRSSSRVLYSDIQGVSYEIKGVLGTVMRYGTVSVEKISTGSTISLSEVAAPRSVEATILQCMEKYVHSKNLKDAKTVKDLLANFVAGSIQSGEFSDDDE